ncbi:acetyl-CoA carboxylase biotin carboxyl carrier protein subunit [bacterium]|nr:acetyl-CoA carboxylase biotin carboxyl carrier protein subunit [bacterium]
MYDRTTIHIGDAKFDVRRSDTDLFVNDTRIDFPEFSLEKRLVTVRLSDRVVRFAVNRNGDDLWLIMSGRVLPLSIETERDRLLKVAAQATTGEGGSIIVKAAMPGLVVRTVAHVGQQVKRGETILILEAMKMENEVRAPADGMVSDIHVKERDSVEKGAHLVNLKL